MTPYELIYANSGTRNQPLSSDLAALYEQAARAAGISAIRVTSGGQPAAGPNRVGSTRHNHGNAGDIQLLVNGRVLNFTNPQDLPIMQKFVSAAHSGGATGIGAGVDYMGPSTLHVGYGAPAVWGAGGSSKNAPDWLREAVGGAGSPSAAYAPRPAQVGGAPDAATVPNPRMRPNLDGLAPLLDPIAETLTGQKPMTVADLVSQFATTALGGRSMPNDPLAGGVSAGNPNRYFLYG